MKKGNMLLIGIIILLLIVIVAGIILYVFVLSKPKDEGPKEIEIPKNMVHYSLGESTGEGGGEPVESFINNVKDSKKMSKVTIKMEVDAKLPELLTYKTPEIVDKINLYLRGMTEEEFAGPEGQKKVKEEIVKICKEAVNTNKTIEVYVFEILVQ